MPIYRGNKARMDYTGLILTEELEAALDQLDSECVYRCSWDIAEGNRKTRTDGEAAYAWSATPCDGPYDTLYFADGKWMDCLPDDEEDEDDWDDENCECEHERCVVCNPASRDDNANSKEA